MHIHKLAHRLLQPPVTIIVIRARRLGLQPQRLGVRDLGQITRLGIDDFRLLAFKLAELDLLTALDGRPPLLLLDDVFSELDPERRSHLVRRIAALPQAFVTTTTLDDLDQGLRAIAHHWEVRAEPDSAGLVGGAGVAP